MTSCKAHFFSERRGELSRAQLNAWVIVLILVLSPSLCICERTASGQGVLSKRFEVHKIGQRLSGSKNNFSEARKDNKVSLMVGVTTLHYYMTGDYEKFTVPDEVSQITVTLYGASGGTLQDTRGSYGGYAYGGNGAMVSAQLTVTPGHTYYIFVGGEGDEYSGGFNGGGHPGYGGYGATGGGGATDFRKSPDLADRMLVAGGGGGVFATCGGEGGYGGYPTGGNGYSGGYCAASYYSVGVGGTQSNGGYVDQVYCLGDLAGFLGQGGQGCYDGGELNGAGGGGGYYGGSGSFGAGGGGGSSYSVVPFLNSGSSYNSGSGYATISYVPRVPTIETLGGTVLYTGGAQTYTVPQHVNFLPVELYGASGSCEDSSLIGRGAMIAASIPVTPGEVLMFFVGGEAWYTYDPVEGGYFYQGGYNGGGSSSRDSNAGGGGGATDVRRYPYSLNDRLLVAGGGGGCYSGCGAAGGGGGYPAGIFGGDSIVSMCSENNAPYPGGGPGTQTEGGRVGILTYCPLTTNTGSFGMGADPCPSSGNGGGGGWYGGGSGYGGGGGGGSSYSSVDSFTTRNADNLGHGYAVIPFFPTVEPTNPPVPNPTAAPSCVPTAAPTLSPTQSPTLEPTKTPTANPSTLPTVAPSTMPTVAPTLQPSTANPTMNPTLVPTEKPTEMPTANPSALPTLLPTCAPTAGPSMLPTCTPTLAPTTQPTAHPTFMPTAAPTASPTVNPSVSPTITPTVSPTAAPTCAPTCRPTALPTCQPSGSPTRQPSVQPTRQPSSQPSCQPSRQPSRQPSNQPSASPTCQPSAQPSRQPSGQPSVQPSRQPSRQPTSAPTKQPSAQPSAAPSGQPSRRPSRQPTGQPSSSPTKQPSSQPSRQPSTQPTVSPSMQPSAQPSCQPTRQPSVQPSRQPTGQPSSFPTVQPSRQPSSTPTSQPTVSPSMQPSVQPSRQPSGQPSPGPTSQPSRQPSASPSRQPTSQPSGSPTRQPVAFPTNQPTAQPSGQPSSQPSRQPSRQPTRQPSSSPSRQPSSQPSDTPTNQPSSAPTAQPSRQPSRQPTGQPTRQPSRQPSSQPSAYPSKQPSGQPSSGPTVQPSAVPTRQPSSQPSRQPSGQPSSQPSKQPSGQPTGSPTTQPTSQPSGSPTRQPSSVPTSQPSGQPSRQPSGQPTLQPSMQPSGQPSSSPTTQPSCQPSRQPSMQPTVSPSAQPSHQPTNQPSRQPSGQPSAGPSGQPSTQPSRQPSKQPSAQPTSQPSAMPSLQPSRQPTSQPSRQPSAQPSGRPTNQPNGSPTGQPSCQPTSQPTGQPSIGPSRAPTAQPSVEPTDIPSTQPSAQPSQQPSDQPSCQPSNKPSTQPTGRPSQQPSAQPSSKPTGQPSSMPTIQPTVQPSVLPSNQPSVQPSAQPTVQPSGLPSVQPTSQPSLQPSAQPSSVPSAQPSCQPSSLPSGQPSADPTAQPSAFPSGQPSTMPSMQPTAQPSTQPSCDPTGQPTSQPSAVPSTQPSGIPSAQPSAQPSSAPSTQPTAQPSGEPTAQPSVQPSAGPSAQPTRAPSGQPSSVPSMQPSAQPSSVPSAQPTSGPSIQPTMQPSSVPSAQPSAQPSTIPSTQPSTGPTRQPSSQPTSLPSAQPTAEPSSSPSGQPTSEPTEQPNASPSATPSAQPTVYPTSQPSAQPSGTPSAQPVCHPTSVPTVTPTAYQTSRITYSKAPTTVPTFSPTLSELSVWSSKLQNVLTEVVANDTSAVAHRSTYFGLNVVSVSPQQRFGGCSAWTRVLSGDVNPSQFAYKPRSVALRVLADDNSHDRLESFNPQTVQCSDPATTASIIAALTSRNAVSRKFSCDSHTWFVRHCPVVSSGTTMHAPAVCVNCIDPCAVTNQCNLGTSLSAEGLSVAPCVQQECSGQSESRAQYNSATSLRVLSVAFASLEEAPTVLALEVVPSRTGMRVTAQLSTTGSLFCAAYRVGATPSAPSSVTAVQLQNFVGSTDASNSTTVTISGLDASTSYQLYLMTVSPAGVRSVLNKILASVRVLNTTCCKTVTGMLVASAFMESRSFTNALSLTFSARPSKTLIVRLELTTMIGNTSISTSQSLFPSTFTVNPLSPIVLSASLPALPVGQFEYRIVLSGASAAEFSSVYISNLQRFAIITTATEPPAPTLLQPVFSSDGSFVTVKFSASTDRGSTATSFLCSALFDFACAASSRCQWIDASTVSAFIKGTSSSSVCAEPGALFGLSMSARIKARCQASGDTGNIGNACPNYVNWKTATTAVQTIAAPAAAVAPKVTISAPSVLGSCDDLYLDVSGSSGSGGRPWASSCITVMSTAGINVTALSSRLRKVTSLTPPSAIAAELFQRGVNYNFIVKLCNFLGQCQTGNKQVLVLNDTLPSVSLPGASLRTIFRKDSLSLASSAFISTCDGMKSSVGLVYKWSVSSNSVELLGLSSTSRDPSRYLLPANSLAAGALYTVSLSVSVVGSAQSSQASVQVYVQSGSVVATIKGGSLRAVRVGEALSLDGSDSYDEDQATGSLKYQWTCAQTAPVFNSSCASILQISSSAQILSLTARESAAGATCDISLTITDAQGKRSSTATTRITVLPTLAPVVSIANPRLPASRVINAGQLLQLTGTLSVPAELGGDATWSLDDSSVDLSSIALFPLTTSVNPVTSASTSSLTSQSFFMALATNSLPVGATLTFSLTGRIPYEGKTSTSSITVTVNAPPLLGNFDVSPTSGVALQQVFQFVAQQWVDPDLPLQYQFGYIDATGLAVTLRSRLELSYGSSMLTAGREERHFAVTCYAQVFDTFNANTSATSTVRVTESVAFNASEAQAFIRTSFATSGSNSDGIRQAVAQSSFLLNAVNCTLAPNCSSLHRQQCSSTAHTCGDCESDKYVGESGDSNEACISIYSFSDRRRLLTSLELQSSEIHSALKPCPADCSGHGKCTHILRDSGAVVTVMMPPCRIGAIDCVAVCECEADYYGSDTCDLTTEEFALRQTSRSSVIAGLQTLVSLENPDEQAINGWVSGLQLASQQAAELTEDSSLAVLGLVDSITAAATALSAGEETRVASLNADTMRGLLKAVNSVTLSTKTAQRRRLTPIIRELAEKANADGDTMQVVAGVLNNVGSLIAQSMLPGQSALNFTQGEVRMSVQILADSSTGVSNITATVPQTALEKYLGKKSSRVSVPSPTGSADSGVSLVVTSVRSELYDFLDSDLQSNPVMLYSSANLCAEPPCFVDLVIQNSQAVDYSALNAPSVYVHNITCVRADYSMYNVTCPDGLTMQMQYNGTAGILHRQCPVTTYSAACDSLRGFPSETSGCVTLAYTDAEVTCRCDTSSTFTQQQRRLQNGNFTVASGYSASYAAMLLSTANSFLSTISTADDLNASTVTKGWRALATLGTLAGAIIFALFWSNYSDGKAKKVSPDPENKNAVDAASLETAKKAKSNKKAANKRRFRFSARSRQMLVNAELAIVEESLPKALSSRTFSDRFLEEVKQHHRWFGIVFYFSDSFPRVLRVISLASNAIIMLFIQSITYNLTNPDDGSCAVFYTEATCLEPKSPFATGESKCAWLPGTMHNSAAGGTCVYVEPDNSVRIILFVAIFCAVVTTPIAMMTDWVVRNVLSAPTETAALLENETAALNLLITTAPLESATPQVSTLADCRSEQVLPAESVQSLAPTQRPGLNKRKSSSGNLASYFTVFNSEMKDKEDKAILATSRAELLMLSMKLKRYREMLRPDELQEFNTLWGLDEDGAFRTSTAASVTWIGRIKERFVKAEEVNVKEAVLGDLQRINTTVQSESKALKASDASKHEIGKKLLFLFQCDLLPGISGKILEQKGGRDFAKVKPVSATSKIMGYTFLFLMNVGMLFYILLFALTQTGPRQNAWFQSFALWLVVEIFMVSTAIVFFTHILIPSMVMKDLTQIKRRLMDNIRDFNDKVSAAKTNPNGLNESEDVQNISFNAANYLFVSTRLARQFPNLKESKIIAQFSTPWPRQSYLHVQNVSKGYSKKFSALTRSASILIIFFVGNFLAVPPSVQDIAVQITSTTAIGYFVFIHVQLYEIFPVLVILPALVIAVLVHFIIQSSKADAKIKLARLFPSNRKKKQELLQSADVTKEGAVSVAVEAEVIGEESKHEYDSSDDYSISSEDSEVAMPVAASNPHRTRRQSINVGLNVLNALHQNQMRPVSEATSSGSGSDCTSLRSEDAHDDDVGAFSMSTYNSADESGDESLDVSDSSSSDSENDETRTRTVASSGDFSDELHTPVGTPHSSPRIVHRQKATKILPVAAIVEENEKQSDSNYEEESEFGSCAESQKESEADPMEMLSDESRSLDSAALSFPSHSQSDSLSHTLSAESEAELYDVESEAESGFPYKENTADSGNHHDADQVEDFASLSSMSQPLVPSRPSTVEHANRHPSYSASSRTSTKLSSETGSRISAEPSSEAPSVTFEDESIHESDYVLSDVNESNRDSSDGSSLKLGIDFSHRFQLALPRPAVHTPQSESHSGSSSGTSNGSGDDGANVSGDESLNRSQGCLPNSFDPSAFESEEDDLLSSMDSDESQNEGSVAQKGSHVEKSNGNQEEENECSDGEEEGNSDQEGIALSLCTTDAGEEQECAASPKVQSRSASLGIGSGVDSGVDKDAESEVESETESVDLDILSLPSSTHPVEARQSMQQAPPVSLIQPAPLSRASIHSSNAAFGSLSDSSSVDHAATQSAENFESISSLSTGPDLIAVSEKQDNVAVTVVKEAPVRPHSQRHRHTTATASVTSKLMPSASTTAKKEFKRPLEVNRKTAIPKLVKALSGLKGTNKSTVSMAVYAKSPAFDPKIDNATGQTTTTADTNMTTTDTAASAAAPG